MTGPVAQSNTPELLDELLVAMRSHPFDQLTVRRIEKRAESLRSVAPVEYFTLKSACATARLDADAMWSAFRSALALAGPSARLWYNHAVSCSVLALHQDSREAIREAIARFNGEVDIARQSYACLLQCGALTSASELSGLFDRCGMDDDTIDMAASMSALVVERGYSEDDVMLLVREARQAAHKHGVIWPQVQFFTSYGFDGPSIVCDFHVTAAPSVARDVERTLFERLAEIDSPLESSGLVTLMVTSDKGTQGGVSNAA